MTTKTELDLNADTIDIRDIIARVEELEAEAQELNQTENFNLWAHTYPDHAAELATLCNILAELAGNGGDEQWRGDWYPLVLIRDSHFKDYIRELLADCGDVSAKLPNYVVVDWDATARNFHVDYSTIEINGATYWYR